MPVIVGSETNVASDIRQALNLASKNGQQFVVLPLFHPRFRRDSQGVSSQRIGPQTKSDLLLQSSDWISNVVGKISEWIDLDNSSENIRTSSEQVLKQEFMWASHLGLQAVLLPSPQIHSTNYARYVNHLCSTSVYQQIWIRIPLIMPLDYHNDTLQGNYSNLDGWEAWDYFRSLCSHNTRLFIALEIGIDLPESEESIARWKGEPVKAVIIPTRIFLTNKTGFPVLSQSHQNLLYSFLQHKVQVIIKGRYRHKDSLQPYIEYIRHLETKFKMLPNQNDLSTEDRLTNSYRDYLQAPLQPLMDNLESQTYEVFEKDPVKYEQYEKAIELALKDIVDSSFRHFSMVQQNSISSVDTVSKLADGEIVTNSSTDEIDEEWLASLPPVVVVVVGAGRGPLVQCVLTAATAVNINVNIYAVEKNVNAVITLRNRCISEMWHNVTVVASDMRSWTPPELADIMVSELLGSWGDNELSPECLDGAQRCLKPNGISIPAEYTSYVAPLSSSKLWTNAGELLAGKGLETPFVVKLHNCYQLAPASPLFTFYHPNPLPPDLINNSKYQSVSFSIYCNATIHGFAGTFSSVLYKDVMLSIEPSTHSPGMFSWFPLFLPLVTPVRVKYGDIITVHIWRCVGDRKVWYEWCLSSPLITPIQNPNGRSYWIGL